MPTFPHVIITDVRWRSPGRRAFNRRKLWPMALAIFSLLGAVGLGVLRWFASARRIYSVTGQPGELVCTTVSDASYLQLFGPVLAVLVGIGLWLAVRRRQLEAYGP